MTNKTLIKLVTLVALALLLVISPLLTGCAREHKPITRELISLVQTNPEVGNMLGKSIAEAKKVNPDPKTNPVQSLSEYYDFINRASELLPQEILKGPSGSVRDQMLQGICYFYFLVGQPLHELKGKGLYKNAIQYYPPFSSWLRNFAKAWGVFLGTKESWNEEIYQQIYNDPKFSLQKG